MFASLSTFKIAPDKRGDAMKAADLCYALVKSMKGFKSVIYLGDYENNEYGTLYIWETKDDLEKGDKELTSKFQDAMDSLALEPPSRHIYEVYEPK